MEKWKDVFLVAGMILMAAVFISIGSFSNRFNADFQRCLSEEVAMSLIQEQFPAPIAERIIFEHNVGDYDIYLYDFGSVFIYYTVHFNHTKHDCNRDSNDLMITFRYSQYDRKWEISKFEWPNYTNYDNYPMPDLV